MYVLAVLASRVLLRMNNGVGLSSATSCGIGRSQTGGRLVVAGCIRVHVAGHVRSFRGRQPQEGVMGRFRHLAAGSLCLAHLCAVFPAAAQAQAA